MLQKLIFFILYHLIGNIYFTVDMDKLLLATLSVLILTGTAWFYTTNLETQQTISHYQSWKQQYGLHFSPSQDLYRMIIFAQNVKEIDQHNLDPTRTYDQGVNKFTGFTNKQFASLYLSPKTFNPEWEKTDQKFQKLGADIDWVGKGKVSKVKDQGKCGSCWAFSAVGVLQSFSLINGKSVDLSEQQLVDCSRKYGNFGCGGGQNYLGLAYVKDHGIAPTSSYPYVAHNEGCKMDGGDFKIRNVPSTKGCPGLITALASRPIGVSVDANNWSPYKSGIFSNCKKDLDHNVLLVGVTDSYWKIKNSWGSDWGENGFIRLAPGNTCGICNDKSPWVE